MREAPPPKIPSGPAMKKPMSEMSATRSHAKAAPCSESDGSGKAQVKGGEEHASAVEAIAQYAGSKITDGTTDIECGCNTCRRRRREATVLGEEEGQPEHEAVAGHFDERVASSHGRRSRDTQCRRALHRLARSPDWLGRRCALARCRIGASRHAEREGNGQERCECCDKSAGDEEDCTPPALPEHVRRDQVGDHAA
eukprot:scaffold187038_cov29-Tisochrysis_lutea.AAC.2